MKSVSVEVTDIIQVVCDSMGLFTDEIDLDVVAGDNDALKSCLCILKDMKWPEDVGPVSYRLVNKTLYCSVDHYEVGDQQFKTLDKAKAWLAEYGSRDDRIYGVAVFKNPVEEEDSKP